MSIVAHSATLGLNLSPVVVLSNAHAPSAWSPPHTCLSPEPSDPASLQSAWADQLRASGGKWVGTRSLTMNASTAAMPEVSRTRMRSERIRPRLWPLSRRHPSATACKSKAVWLRLSLQAVLGSLLAELSPAFGHEAETCAGIMSVTADQTPASRELMLMSWMYGAS